MTFTFNETVEYVQFVLVQDLNEVRKELHQRLSDTDRTEGEFYAGIVKHGPGFLTNEQWFELLRRLPVELLWSQLELERILSEEQRGRLPTPL